MSRIVLCVAAASPNNASVGIGALHRCVSSGTPHVLSMVAAGMSALGVDYRGYLARLHKRGLVEDPTVCGLPRGVSEVRWCRVREGG